MPGRKATEETRRAQILQAAFEVASREGLEGLTIRLVAGQARLSSGLVLFHFESKDRLVFSMLEHLLATTTVLRLSPALDRIEPPLQRLRAVLRVEMDRLSSEPRRIRLFFDFWALGGRNPAIGAKMRAELARYRTAFRPIAKAVIAAQPKRFSKATANGLAGVAVSFIKGCAVQAMIDPEHFDIRVYLAAVEGFLG